MTTINQEYQLNKLVDFIDSKYLNTEFYYACINNYNYYKNFALEYSYLSIEKVKELGGLNKSKKERFKYLFLYYFIKVNEKW